MTAALKTAITTWAIMSWSKASCRMSTASTDADEGFDDDLDEDAGPSAEDLLRSSLIPSTIDR